VPESAGEQAWKLLCTCTGRFGVEVGPGAVSSGAGGGTTSGCPPRLGLAGGGAVWRPGGCVAEFGEE
jgi:hypothetical protein